LSSSGRDFAARVDVSPRDAFGPNLRRQRLKRGVPLERIAESTKVCVALWAGLERNDLSRWPTGIYARSYLRDYARAVGADPEATVDEFCRLFPHGDRRVAPLIRDHSAIIGHPSAWQDEVPAKVVQDRRGTSPSPQTPASSPPVGLLSQIVGRLRRVLSGA